MTMENEVLVVASKVKGYIKEKSGLKCSAEVITELSNQVRDLLDSAISSATADKRKTVKARDLTIEE